MSPVSEAVGVSDLSVVRVRVDLGPAIYDEIAAFRSAIAAVEFAREATIS